MFLAVCSEPPSWWLWSGLSQHESLWRKRSPHVVPFWRCCYLHRCPPRDCGMPIAMDKKLAGPGCGNWRIKYSLEWQTMHGWAVYGRKAPARCRLAQGLIFTDSHLLYGSVTFFWNFFFTSLFWLGSGIHKIPREQEVWSMACKRRRGEAGEWIEESFPLPCHSLPNAGLMPLSSSPKLQASEKRREKGRREGGKLPSPFGRQDPSLSR